MNSEEEEEEEEKHMVIIVAALNLIKRKRYKNHKNSRKKISIWTKPWLLRRTFLGIYNTLIEAYRIVNQTSYNFFLRMTEGNFLEILYYIENDIKKQDTKFRQAIPPNIKLAATIRFLATGAS